MALDPVLTKIFPRDFKNIPLGKYDDDDNDDNVDDYDNYYDDEYDPSVKLSIYLYIYPGTEYGVGSDETLNKEIEDRKLQFLEDELFAVLKQAVQNKERPMFTTALIAGEKDCS
jgi:hypothetical protein